MGNVLEEMNRETARRMEAALNPLAVKAALGKAN
jgi:hypothetical protein